MTFPRVLALAAVTALSLGAAAVDAPAPAFSSPATNGKTVTLAQFKGKKTVVLAFFPKAFTGG